MIVSTRNSCALAGLGLILAGACSSPNHPTVVPESGSGGSAGGEKTVAAGSSGRTAESAGSDVEGEAGFASNAGAPERGLGSAGGSGESEAPQAGAAGDGASTAGSSSVLPLPDPACHALGTLTDGARLSISTDATERFGGVTPDELAIAWTIVNGDQVLLSYATRPTVDAEFLGTRQLSLAAAAEAVTLSSDGLHLVYTKLDRKGFGELSRASREDPFTEATSSSLVPVNESVPLAGSGEYVGDPVLGGDGMTFFYTRYRAGLGRALLSTIRFSEFGAFPEGWPVDLSPALLSSTSSLTPTGVSVDRQALFLWDSAGQRQIVATLAHDTLLFEPAFELNDARGAAPNGSCTRVYYDRDGDLWSATLK
jgi:hypothetical protein